MSLNLVDLIRSALNYKKPINTKHLPSQGLFYKNDFKIRISKADEEDIKNYERDFKKNLNTVVYQIKKIVRKNIFFSNEYKFNDLKSIDIVYVFLEIVKFTRNKSIKIKHSSEKEIEFNSKNFNYFKIDENTMRYYEEDEQCFRISNYKYTLPTIGIEISLTNYLGKKSLEPDSEKYNDYFYDFIYFLGNKSELSFTEIDNLIQIFNFDLNVSELAKIKDIINRFLPIQIYSLIKGDEVIDINAMINLEDIWNK